MDTISNMLVMIKNASLRFHEKVDVPYSKMNLAILNVLKEEGFITNYKVIKDAKSKFPKIRVLLKYTQNRLPVFCGFKRISKPSRRIYRGYDEFPRVKTSFGINIVSTPKGVMSGHKAKKERVGGEVICQVW